MTRGRSSLLCRAHVDHIDREYRLARRHVRKVFGRLWPAQRQRRDLVRLAPRGARALIVRDRLGQLVAVDRLGVIDEAHAHVVVAVAVFLRVVLDLEHAGDADVDTSFFFGLADRRLRRVLATVDATTGQPEPRVGKLLHQQEAVVLAVVAHDERERVQDALAHGELAGHLSSSRRAVRVVKMHLERTARALAADRTRQVIAVLLVDMVHRAVAPELVLGEARLGADRTRVAATCVAARVGTGADEAHDRVQVFHRARDHGRALLEAVVPAARIFDQLRAEKAHKDLLADRADHLDHAEDALRGQPRGAEDDRIERRRRRVAVGTVAVGCARMRLDQLVHDLGLVEHRDLRDEAVDGECLHARIVQRVERHVVARNVADHQPALHAPNDRFLPILCLFSNTFRYKHHSSHKLLSLELQINSKRKKWTKTKLFSDSEHIGT